jgi:hypothetical protein
MYIFTKMIQLLQSTGIIFGSSFEKWVLFI